MNDLGRRVDETKRHYERTPFDFEKIRGEIFKAGLTYHIFENYDLSGKTIVDVGCSTSYLGDYIKENYPHYSYLGIDVNPKAIELARAKGLNAREGNNLCLDLPDNYSDVTISEGVIHHTPAPFQCFKELIRITKKGGLISLYVYNRNHPYCVIYKASTIIRWLYKQTVGHAFVRKVVFPLFSVFYVQLGNRLYFKNTEAVPKEVSWNIFHDQILTPIAHFFVRADILDFAKDNGLRMVKEKLSINKQGLMFVFEKMQQTSLIQNSPVERIIR